MHGKVTAMGVGIISPKTETSALTLNIRFVLQKSGIRKWEVNAIN